MTIDQGYVNHIVLALDASGSMQRHANALIKVADAQIARLAQRSKELDQETRVTVYVFNGGVQCVVYDKDVLRLPSISTFYRATGNTALIDATLLSLSDLALTPEKYGDHAFLIYVLTDGQENASRAKAPELSRALASLPEHWTVAAFVPDILGKSEAKKFGFPADNIAIWDTTSDRGVVEVGRAMTTATENYMLRRATGERGTRSLFSTGADAVNAQTVAAAGIRPLAATSFKLIPVPPSADGAQIRDFVQGCGLPYVVGNSYYQLSKTETIQPNKLVAIVEKKTAKVYLGREARDLINLPDVEVRVKPDFNRDFDVFVQSTSVNRKVVVGTRVLVLS